jgi:hypothetical protein
MRKWKINNGPAVIPEVIDRGEKLAHHDYPIVSASRRKCESAAGFFESAGDDEKKDLQKEISSGIDAMLSVQFVEVKREAK